MTTPRGMRRFLRFSLRSLFLLTLAVAVWLGYEVHQVRTVERQAEAIRALGGDVEFDFGGRTLLGSFEPERYGRRIVTATIRVDAAQEGIAVLASASAIRSVRLLQDGSADLGPFLARVGSQWPEARVTVSGSVVPQLYWPVPPEPWQKSKARQRYARFYAAVKESTVKESSVKESTAKESAVKERAVKEIAPPRRRLLAALERLLDEGPQFDSLCDAYRVVPQRDGSSAELLVVSRGSLWGLAEAELILLVADTYVDARYIDASHVDVSRFRSAVGGLEIEDLDGDGSLDVGVRGEASYNSGRRSQPWLAQYAIEPTGFRSQMPEDRFKD